VHCKFSPTDGILVYQARGKNKGSAGEESKHEGDSAREGNSKDSNREHVGKAKSVRKRWGFGMGGKKYQKVKWETRGAGPRKPEWTVFGLGGAVEKTTG